MKDAPGAARRGTWTIARCAALAVLASGRAAGQDLETRESVVRVDDSRTTDERLVHGDCAAVVLAAGESGLDVMVEMAKPLAHGMYTRVVLWIDCDDDPKTGLEAGYELVVRAACGTRFGPSTPAAGADPSAPQPLSIRRCSWSDIDRDVIASTGATRRSWTLRDSLDEPRVEDRELRFRVPKDLIRRYGDRYHSRFTAVARIDTVCCEQPILLEHACSDEGVAFKVDGSDEDWTGGTSAADPPGELHAAVASVDLVSAAVDHSA